MEHENALKPLAGLPLAKVGRAADLVWLQFGALKSTTTKHGTRTTGDWAVHLQTSWRFVRDSKIILAVGDLYLLANGDSYDWDIGGENHFDHLATSLNDTLSSASVVVDQIKCDDVGGFSLALSDGARLDVFPKISDTLDDFEHWRILQPDRNGGQFVCQTRNA